MTSLPISAERRMELLRLYGGDLIKAQAAEAWVMEDDSPLCLATQASDEISEYTAGPEQGAVSRSSLPPDDASQADGYDPPAPSAFAAGASVGTSAPRVADPLIPWEADPIPAFLRKPA